MKPLVLLAREKLFLFFFYLLLAIAPNKFVLCAFSVAQVFPPLDSFDRAF
jgi:hypothetical protein